MPPRLCLALFSFDPDDPGWTYTGTTGDVNNLVGLSGAWIADAFFGVLGYTAFIFPVLLAAQCWFMFRERRLADRDRGAIEILFKAMGLLLTLGAGAGLAELHFYELALKLSGAIIPSCRC